MLRSERNTLYFCEIIHCNLLSSAPSHIYSPLFHTFYSPTLHLSTDKENLTQIFYPPLLNVILLFRKNSSFNDIYKLQRIILT